MKKLNRKIPGIVATPPKTEIDGKIEDLSAKSILELKEIRDRQVKLLNNKLCLSKLTDRGAKIQLFYEKLLAEIKVKEEEKNTCKLFSRLNLQSLEKETVQELEWKGNFEGGNQTFLDSDDDSEPEDILSILSQRTTKERIVKVIREDKSLITSEDLKSTDENPHVKYIVDKTEKTNTTHEKFKPYKTTKSDDHNPEKEILRKKHKNWENTAATPPPIIHGPIKVLSLGESLTLQKEQNMHLKEVESQHAAEKLLAKFGIKMGEIPKDAAIFGNYRKVESDSSISDAEGSDKEIHDEEPEKGGVIFTVMK